MGKRHGHVTIEERCEIACLQAEGRSVRQIAADLDRSPVAGSQTGEYKPVYADHQARARRWRGSGMERDETLRARVLSHLAQGWSPEQVAGRLELEAGRVVISYESIYRFIYGQLARTKDYRWRHYLPRGKSKRGWRGRKGGSPASLMAMRRPIAERPLSAGDRRTPGHWEADLMLFRTYGHAVLTMHERHSRILIAVRPPGKASSLGRHVAGARSVAAPMATDGYLRQRDRVRPPLPTPRSGYRNLFLRYLLPLAQGRGGERHRPVATDSAPQDRPGGVAGGAVYTDDSGLQQYPAKVPELQDPGRNILGKRVALEM